ncbi:antiviral reverse transcriptase Drt3a [Pseudomonas oryzihabitans]|uniref:antiviral reverse transcriptase Drt3a n=1 Tax=Pseudomonas oryzihabitans TaxID=47885 RepID=UPI00135E604F|nr:antiviral reverse transcriptase Drt3a [Pseudomonas oryzihabitans]MXS19262.1 hypothetical protein [Pseudomonas oryzihabitans]
MYDQTFTARTLAKEFRGSDFDSFRYLRDEEKRQKTVDEAAERFKAGIELEKLVETRTIRGKSIHSIKNFQEELIIRKLTRNLAYQANIKQQNRDPIICTIANLLEEGIIYRVYRLDIKSFYESLPSSLINKELDDIKYLSNDTKALITKILTHFSSNGIGIPRGLSLSAVLAELAMKNFDNAVRCHEQVTYYCRYVDDILIITTGEEKQYSFIRELRKSLPSGLEFNRKKFNVIEAKEKVKFQSVPKTNQKTKLPPQGKATSALLSFEFLGYEFEVFNPIKSGIKLESCPRTVTIDIAKSKVRKIKSRLAQSFLSYKKSKDYSLLRDRIRYLTSNFSVKDADRQRKRLAGIYHNYHRAHASTSKSLKDLDHFLFSLLILKNSPLTRSILLSKKQEKELNSFSFRRGFEEKTYSNFSSERLVKIQECWKYA